MASLFKETSLIAETARRSVYPRVYFWCTGQDDNIGDVVLRRQLLHVLMDGPSDIAKSLHIYIGPASESFVDSLDIPQGATVYRTKAVWLASLIRELVKPKPPVLVFNPGEVQRNLKTTLAYGALLGPALVIQLRGGSVARTGTAIDHRGAGPIAAIAKLAIQASDHFSSVASWRDTASKRAFKKGRLVPDWAIANPPKSYSEINRTILAVTYRADRRSAFDEVAIEKIKKMAAFHGLSVVVYCQVIRDRKEMQRLASQEGWDYLDWSPGDSHRRQEDRVRVLLRQSEWVCSNRIHALIIGLTEGAQAVCISSDDEPKVSTHLGDFGLATVIDKKHGDSDSFSALEERRAADGAEALMRASQDVNSLAREVRASFGY